MKRTSSRSWLLGIAALIAAGGSSFADEPEVVRSGEPRRAFRASQRDGVTFYSYVGKTPPVEQILPATPKAFPRVTAKTEFADLPEVGLFDPLEKSETQHETKHDSMAPMTFVFAKVNYFNRQQTDGFLKALLPLRPDLAGLPFRMGLDCRLDNDQAGHFAEVLRKGRGEPARHAVNEDLKDAAHRPLARAMMQIHGPKGEHAELAKQLGAISDVEATRGLARIALFSPDDSAREIAARRLKVRRDQDYTDLLVSGLRYPWPSVARRAAEAIVRLDRKDLAVKLVETLESPDPRLAAKSGEVRELVRINHHRNCLLCHPPAFTKVILKMPDGTKTLEVEQQDKAMEKLAEERDPLLAPVPLPDRAIDMSRPYGRGSEMDDILVRVDATYLRQDFSMMLPVENAAPWPDFQRYDFLVRTRTLTPAEAAALRERIERESAGSVSPYQRAALYGLRELTGQEASTAADWRRLLKL